MPRRRQGVLAFVAAALAVCLWAPSAFAGTAQVAGGVLRYDAAAGEANALTVSASTDPDSGDDVFAVSDLGADVTPGPGCGPDDDAGALCDPSATSLAVQLGDGDDEIDLGPDFTLATTIDAGPGADFVSGGAGEDHIFTNDGEADDVTCGGGSDTVVADALDTVAHDCESVSIADAGSPSGGPSPSGTTTVAPPRNVSPGKPANELDCRRTLAGTRHRVRCRLNTGRASIRGRVTFTARNLRGRKATGSANVRSGKASVTLRSARSAGPGIWTIQAVVNRGHARPLVYERIVVLF